VLRCQAVAKYQQAVEKSIKAAVAGLRDAKIAPRGPSFDHELGPDFETLEVLPSRPRAKNVAYRVSQLVSPQMQSDMGRVLVLSPKRPDRSRGEIARLNTEYPYERAAGDWHAPAEPDSFSQGVVEEYARIAGRTTEKCKRILDILELAP
jgi:hypothetical protein